MSNSEEHKALLAAWQLRYKNQAFVCDGIIDEECWRNSSPKVLFLLFENYDKENTNEGWDLTTHLLKHIKEHGRPYGHAFSGLQYLAYASSNSFAENILPVPRTEGEKKKAVDALRSSAIINVKKIVGESTSCQKDLEKYAKNDREYLLRQINLLSPDLIVSCGLSDRILEILWEDKTEIYPRVYALENEHLINFWHPANRGPKECMYYGFAWLLQRIPFVGQS